MKLTKPIKTVRLDRIIHVVVRDPEEQKGKPLLFEAISGEPNQRGKSLNVPCTKEIYHQVLGERTENTVTPKLRGDQRHTFLARFESRKFGKEEFDVVTGVDAIPLRFFAGSSGPVTQKEKRINGFEIEWSEDHNGFRVKEAYLGMNQRRLINLLNDIRENMGKKRSYNTKCGHVVKALDDFTLHVKNPKPYTESGI